METKRPRSSARLLQKFVELIKSEHREVKRLFDLLKTQPATRSLNFPVLCSLLIAHSRAEEAEVYPIAKSEAGETDEVARSRAKHAEAEHMLEQMAALNPGLQRFASSRRSSASPDR